MEAALIAASVAVVGWFATYALARRSAAATVKRDAALRHLERQLGELYGPLAFSVLEGKRVFEDLVQDFGTDWATGGRSLTEEEVQKWLFWSDQYFFPRNERIQELLSTKAHLIEGGQIPPSFVAFVGHHSSWKLDHLRWQSTGIRERLYSRRRWPVEFGDEILATFAVLKRRHDELLGAQGPTGSATHSSQPPTDDGPPRGIDEWATP